MRIVKKDDGGVLDVVCPLTLVNYTDGNWLYCRNCCAWYHEDLIPATKLSTTGEIITPETTSVYCKEHCIGEIK